MKKTLVTSIALLSLMMTMISCGGKTKTSDNSTNENKENTAIVEFANIDFSETHFGDNWNHLENSVKQLTKEEYKALNLDKLSFIPDFGELQYEIGSNLIDEPARKLLTVKAVSSGEISEYLLGYVNNTITDSLLVAYEDNVEYFSNTSAVLEGNKITVTTIDFDYSGTEEVSDTIKTSYIISKELTFDEVLK